MAQFARPIADADNTGGWTTTPLWSKIDEGAPGDSTIITSPTAANLFFTVQLGTVTDPAVSTGHVIRALGGKTVLSGPEQSLVIELRQGYVDETTQGTLIATFTGTSQEGSMLLETYTLSGAEADAITDYSDLYLRAVCRGADIDFIELEVPDAAGGTPGSVSPSTIVRDFTVESVTIAGIPVNVTPAAISRLFALPTVTAGGASFAWEDTFVPPNAVTGMALGDHTAIDEWPWTSDDCYAEHTSLGTSTVTFTFDMSNGPGDKKGFRVWFRSHAELSAGYDITAVRLTDGTSTLWTDSAPGITITEAAFNDSLIRVIDVPDSAFSGDPTISGLVLEMDLENLNAGNNRLRFSGMRMSKSPFTAAQEADVPADLVGANFSCYRASDFSTLGLVDGASVVVWPDASGKGRHLIQLIGTTATYEADTIDYVNFPSTANRFVGHFGTRVTGNHIWHSHWHMVDTTAAQVVTSHADDFAGAVSPPTDPNDKNLVGVDDNGTAGDDRIVIMSGDGTGPAHDYGATVISFDTWYRTTLWVQDAGNEKLWIDDLATPDIDFASGSNNMFTVSVGDRESDDRRFQGRIAEVWWIDGAGVIETDIDGARDEWVNGPASGVTVSPTAIARSFISPAANLSSGALVAPTSIATIADLLAATIAAGANTTPNMIARVFNALQASLSAEARVAPVTAVTVADLLSAIIAAGAGSAPDTVVGSFTTPPPSLASGAQVNPGVSTIVTDVLAAVVQAGSSATPDTIISSLNTLTTSPAAGAVVTPDAAGIVVDLFAAIAQGSASVDSSLISRVFVIPQATTSVEGGPVTVAPSVVLASIIQQAASISAGALIGIDTLSQTVELPVTAASAGSSASPSVISRLVNLLATSVGAGGTLNPAAINRVFALPQSNTAGGTLVTPEGVPIVTTQGQVVITASGSVDPAVVSRVLEVLQAAATAGFVSNPAVIDRSIDVPSALIEAAGLVLPDEITQLLTAPQVNTVAGETVTNPATVVVLAVPQDADAQGEASVIPNDVEILLTVPQAVAHAVGLVSPDSIAQLLTLLSASVGASANSTPGSFELTTDLPLVTPRGPVVITPDEIDLVLAVLDATPVTIRVRFVETAGQTFLLIENVGTKTYTENESSWQQ